MKFLKRKFSWERPIEEELLAFVRNMANQMESVAYEGQEEVREGAGCYAKAYRTVERYILREIKLRSGIGINRK